MMMIAAIEAVQSPPPTASPIAATFLKLFERFPRRL
jgi:hypothetical protein